MCHMNDPNARFVATSKSMQASIASIESVSKRATDNRRDSDPR